MDLKHLNCFLKVVECNNFTRAAKELNYSTSTVTQNIHALEKELQFELFNRASRPLELTPAGKYFYEQSVELLSKMNKSIQTARIIANNQTHKIVVNFCITDSCFIPVIRNYFSSQQNNAAVSFRSVVMQRLVESLKEGTCDYIFCKLNDSVGDMECIPLVSAHYSCLLPKTHPLAKKQVLTIQDFSSEGIICVQTVGNFEEQQFFSKIMLEECPSMTFIAALNIEEGERLSKQLGYPVLSYEHLFSEKDPDYRVIPFQPDFAATYGLVSYKVGE